MIHNFFCVSVIILYIKLQVQLSIKLFSKLLIYILTGHTVNNFHFMSFQIAEDFMDSFSDFLQNRPMKFTVDWEKRY